MNDVKMKRVFDSYRETYDLMMEKGVDYEKVKKYEEWKNNMEAIAKHLELPWIFEGDALYPSAYHRHLGLGYDLWRFFNSSEERLRVV